MKNFLLKKTDDGIHHLFLDDSSKNDFVKIAEATHSKFIKGTSYVVMKNPIKNDIKVYGIEHDKVFEASIPSAQDIKFVDGICMYAYNGNTYAIVPNVEKTEADIVLLGTRHSLYLNPEAIMFYNMIAWNYFTYCNDSLLEVKFVVDGRLVSVGPYLCVKDRATVPRIICRRHDDLYDMYAPNSAKTIDGKHNRIFYRSDRREVFVWQDNEQGWKSYCNSYLWGNNAMYSINVDGMLYLYKLTVSGVYFVTKGKFYVGKDYVCVDGVYYFLRAHSEVDFEHPKKRKGFWRNLKEFFKS